MHTYTPAKAHARALKLAASADPARNDNEAERATALAKLVAHCERHSLNVADYVKPVASPSSGNSKADARDAERERATANRAFTMQHYSGASFASHAGRAPKLADAIERVANPVQCAKSASTRDESGIMLAAKHANASGVFCPLAATFDLGVLSRLASLKLIAVSGSDKLKLTKAGSELAANLGKRKAA